LKLTTRICEICGSGDQELIHRQYFLFPGLAQPAHYSVLACRACGFAFASDIPDQSVLNQFYQASEHHLHTSLPPGLQRIHADFFQFVHRHAPLASDTRILDIGSGMGHFLHHFQNAGFHRLLGVEPSAAAAALAEKTYGLEIRTATIDAFAASERFGLISLCGVLEHIADLQHSMASISRLLQDDGHLFIAVPDAATFGNTPPAEPFLEFALEHINFFSATSLDNLLRANGLEPVAVASHYNDFYGNHYLLALYRKTCKAPAHLRIDEDAAPSLRAYTDLSRDTLRPVEELAVQLVESQEPLLIWGAGALTSRLLCDTRLGDANLRGIVDRNQALHGRPLRGVPISAPDTVVHHPGATVFIASTTYAAEIHAMLIEQYHWRGRIIGLLPGATQ